MSTHVKAWQCIGCGSIQAPQTCIEVCEHHKVEFVYADEHEREMAAWRARNDALQALLRRLAATHPREGQHEATFRSFQQEARALLAEDHAVAIEAQAA